MLRLNPIYWMGALCCYILNTLDEAYYDWRKQ
jgi:hypothetical protein